MTAQPATAAWYGRLALDLERRGARTVLTRSQMAMPLAVQRPFYPEGDDVCHVVVLHPPGGMVGGDQLQIEAVLGAGAEALLTTPSAAKWYGGHSPATQSVSLRVGPGAHAEWLPLETIVFDGAQVRQVLTVELADGATFAAWDITRFGRSARGEVFQSGGWRADSDIRCGQRLLWIDRQRLAGGASLMQSAYGLANQPVMATFVFVGRGVAADFVDHLRRLWHAGGYDGEPGVSRLPHGVICRYRGPASATARAWFTSVWDAIRREVRQRPAHPPRLWRT